MVLNATEGNLTGNGSIMGSISNGEIPGSLRFIGGTLGMIIVPLGVFGNGLTLVAIATTRNLRKMGNLIIASLSFCDLFVSLAMVMPQVIIYIAGVTLHGIASELVCFVQMTYTVNGFLHIAGLSLQRYLKIVHAQFVLKKKYTIFYLVVIYILPIGFYLSGVFRRMKNQTKSVSTYLPYIHLCQAGNVDISHFTFLFVLFAVFVIIVIYFYIAILFYVKIKQKNIQMTTNAKIRNRKNIQLAKSVVVIFITYALGYFMSPILIRIDVTLHLPLGLYACRDILLWVSVANNWVIYGYFNREFRVAYKKVLGLDSHAITPVM